MNVLSRACLLMLSLVLAGCGGDDRRTYDAAVNQIGDVSAELQRLLRGLPDSGFDDSGIGDYASDTIRPLAEALRDDIEEAKLALGDPEGYEIQYGRKVDDFIRGVAWADAQRFRGDIADLQEDLDRADRQLSELSQLSDDIEQLISDIDAGELETDATAIPLLEQLLKELRAVRTLYTESLGRVEDIAIDELPPAVQSAIRTETSYLTVEDLQPAIDWALADIRGRYASFH